jgi:hypothetical protein
MFIVYVWSFPFYITIVFMYLVLNYASETYKFNKQILLNNKTVHITTFLI